MKTSACATLVVAALAPIASAAKYNAICVFDELKCGGSIQLREYTPDTPDKCDSGDCTAITAVGATTFSVLPTCTDDHVDDTEKHLRGKPYVIVENYAGDGCTGEFTKAIAVVASGNCFPSSKADMSYKVTLGANDLSVLWMQYEGANCSTNATEVSFAASEVDRKTCVKNTMKVLAVKPGGSKPAASNTNGSSAAPSATSSGIFSFSTSVVALVTAGLATTTFALLV